MVARLLFLLLTSSLFSESYFFVPPPKWEPVNQEAYSPRTKAAFICPQKKNFFSSTLSLQIDACQDEAGYLESTQKCLEKDRNKKCHFLSKIKTKMGDAHLLQTDVKGGPFGDVTILQSLVYTNPKMIVLTAATLSSQLPSLYVDLLRSFESLQRIENPLDFLTKEERKELRSKSPQKLESFLVKSHPELGPYFVILALEQLKEESCTDSL